MNSLCATRGGHDSRGRKTARREKIVEEGRNLDSERPPQVG
jgi:hypothetical protein